MSWGNSGRHRSENAQCKAGLGEKIAKETGCRPQSDLVRSEQFPEPVAPAGLALQCVVPARALCFVLSYELLLEVSGTVH